MANIHGHTMLSLLLDSDKLYFLNRIELKKENFKYIAYETKILYHLDLKKSKEEVEESINDREKS